MFRVRWGLIAFITVALVYAFILNERADREAVPVFEDHPTPAGVLVRAEDYGDRWPFSVPYGYADCVRGGSAVFRTPENRTFGITGLARSQGYPSVEPIWLDDPNIPGAKIPTSEIIRTALDQCD